MRVLLDTCVISELAREGGKLAVRRFVEQLDDDDTFLSVITVGEITNGVMLLPPGKRKTALERWLLELERGFAGRLLPVDYAVASVWGEITARVRLQGSTLPIADGLIAATALHHGLHVATRNVKDFAASGVLLVDPLEGTA